MEMLLSALKRLDIVDYKSTRDLAENNVCSTTNEECMLNKCKICMNKGLKFKEVQDETNVMYWRWKNVTEKKIIKTVEKNIKRVTKCKVTSPLAEVKELLMSELQIVQKTCIFHEASSEMPEIAKG